MTSFLENASSDGSGPLVVSPRRREQLISPSRDQKHLVPLAAIHGSFSPRRKPDLPNHTVTYAAGSYESRSKLLGAKH
jgi:hypothetical protein